MSLEGQRLGEFEILERLGQGGMGAVYKARQISLKRFVALKALQEGLAFDPEYIARFHREAIAAAALNHPNLVQVYSAGESDGLYWFAMEYVEGESAQARVKRKERLDPAEAITIGIHIATALEYGWRKAHLIHRDIKPDNIFLSSDGEVKLGDLGLAKNAEETLSLTISGAYMGTPHYISPEQAEGKKEVDLRADIYSLGCTIFHLVAGKPPYSGDSALAVMMKHVSAPIPSPQHVWPGFPAELAQVVKKMMAKSPSARQQTYADVIADLRRAYDALTGETLPAGVAVSQPPQDQSSTQPPAQERPSTAKNPAVPRKRLTVPFLAMGVVGLIAVVAALIYFAPWKKAGATSTTPTAATKDAPFVNTLGMKFVPVPIDGGPTKGQQVLFGVWDVRVQDYAAYAAAGAKKTDDAWAKQEWEGMPVGREMNHPVVGVSWEDAQGFCQWLTEKEQAEGKLPKGWKYRLPSDEEWSLAVGLPPELGATPAEKHQKNSVDFPWGKDWPPTRKVGNYADETFHGKFPLRKIEKENRMENQWLEGYTDGYATTSPVGNFPANAYGLYDMGGNVCQWCEDWFDKVQKGRVVRGGSWRSSGLGYLKSSSRVPNAPGYHDNNYGFRCVLAPTTSAPDAAAAKSELSNPAVAVLAATTKAKPFVNTLGMKFVPVPIVSGPSAGQRVLFGVWDVRVQDYAAYAGAKKVDDAWTKQQKNGVPVGRELKHPVVGVSWEEAQDFCQWLTEKESAEGKLPKGWKYRLPSDEEWSWAVGLPPEVGSTPAEKRGKNSVDYPWGKDWPPTKTVGNYADEAFHGKFPPKKNEKYNRMDEQWIEGYDDHYATTSLVGSFSANAYGLYDMGGNVWQWCEDWFDASHVYHVLRGGSWSTHDRSELLSSGRTANIPSRCYEDGGFRCVLASSASTLVADVAKPELSNPAVTVLAATTKAKPFVNTLGMKFVPVPIVSGPSAGQRVLFGVWDVRVQDYAAYAGAKKVDDAWTKQEKDGVLVGRELNHPVVGVSWEDAQGFCQWLTEKDIAEAKLPKGWKYRLPSDEEWSWAVGLPPEVGGTPAEKSGKNTVDFPWGKDYPPMKKVGNYADETFHAKFPKDSKDKEKDQPWIKGYDDGCATTSPVGSFPANVYGLFDMGGNVWQWCEDWSDKDQKSRVLRGGSWDFDYSALLRSSHRLRDAPSQRYRTDGFRCVLGESAR